MLKYDLRKSSIGSTPTPITQCPDLLQQMTNLNIKISADDISSASNIISTLINHTTNSCTCVYIQLHTCICLWVCACLYVRAYVCGLLIFIDRSNSLSIHRQVRYCTVLIHNKYTSCLLGKDPDQTVHAQHNPAQPVRYSRVNSGNICRTGSNCAHYQDAATNTL